MSHLFAQVQVLQNKVNSLSDARTVHNSESQDHAVSRFWIAARYTEYCEYFRKRFERLPAREGRPSAIFDNSKNLASNDQKLRLDTTGNTKRPDE